MSTDDTDDSLLTWCHDNGFDKYYKGLKDCDIDSVDDFYYLYKKDVEPICDELGLKFAKRNKFKILMEDFIRDNNINCKLKSLTDQDMDEMLNEIDSNELNHTETQQNNENLNQLSMNDEEDEFLSDLSHINSDINQRG
eukprot:342141_1